VSDLIGDFNFLCTCVFKNTDELFSLIKNIKTIERTDKVAWSEEVRSIEIEQKIGVSNNTYIVVPYITVLLRVCQNQDTNPLP
jgi:hypothetical protein